MLSCVFAKKTQTIYNIIQTLLFFNVSPPNKENLRGTKQPAVVATAKSCFCSDGAVLIPFNAKFDRLGHTRAKEKRCSTPPFILRGKQLCTRSTNVVDLSGCNITMSSTGRTISVSLWITTMPSASSRVRFWVGEH